MMPKKSMSKVTIPTLLGVVFLVLGIAAGVFVVQSRQIFRSRASDPPKPRNVTITNVSDSSFTVSWITDEESTGFVAWGESEREFNSKTETSLASLVQSVDIRDLNPQSTYYFQVFVNDKPYLNDSVPWKVNTLTQLPPPSKPSIASGTILNPDGTPSDSTIVYLDVDSGSTRSAITSENGRWIIPISEVRDNSLNSYISIDEQSSLIQLNATNGRLQASASLRPNGSNPSPDIVLGNSYDFLSSTLESQTFQNPEANVNLNQSVSKSDEALEPSVSPTNAPSQIPVEITSLKDKQTIQEELPEFFGVGTPNLEITITIESDPITEILTINEGGSWNWLPPMKLEDGPHTITISYLDISGVLQSIKREFTINAAGDETITNTPTLFPTSTLSPTSIPKTIATSAPTTEPELPDTGVIQNSLVLLGFFVTTAALSLLILLI